jgi:hypothetical protein
LQQANTELRAIIEELKRGDENALGLAVESHASHSQIDDSTNYRSIDSPVTSSDDELDVAPDKIGQAGCFVSSSALHYPTKSESSSTGPLVQSPNREHMKNKLIAHTALQEQKRNRLFNLPDIDGVPTELALHFLDVH